MVTANPGVAEPLGHRARVLLDQHGGRREDARLLAALHGAEDRAQGDLGLAVADVAADQAIHRARCLHVGEHRVDRGRLIRRLVERELRLELVERVVGRREAMAGQGGALRVDLEQLLGERADGAADLARGRLPRDAAELVEPRRVALRADVALHLAEPVDRQVERAAVVVDLQGVQGDAAVERELLQALIAADAVPLVDEVVAGPQLAEIRDAAEQRVLRALALVARVVRALAEHVGRGDERDAVFRRGEARGRRAGVDRDLGAQVAGRSPAAPASDGEPAAGARRSASIRAALQSRRRRSRRAGHRRRQRRDRVDERLHVLGLGERARVIELLAQRAQIVDIDAQLRGSGGVVGPASSSRQLEVTGAAPAAPRLRRRRRAARDAGTTSARSARRLVEPRLGVGVQDRRRRAGTPPDRR